MKKNSSFNESTYSVDNQIVINAFGHCSAIFSQFVQSRITPELDSIGNDILDLDDILNPKEQNYCLLETKLFGAIEGSSFLILNPDEVEYMISELLKMQSRDLEEAFLLELDNIVTAAVVSTLSDALEVEFFGDVPHHTTLSGKECMNRVIENISPEETNMDKTILHFQFSIDSQPSWKPVYLWVFDNLNID